MSKCVRGPLFFSPFLSKGRDSRGTGKGSTRLREVISTLIERPKEFCTWIERFYSVGGLFLIYLNASPVT
jgi:hypothetical protein